MPNIATPLQTSSLPNNSPTNAHSSIDRPNNSTNEQFSNVLARGISEETATHETASSIANNLSDTLPNHEASEAIPFLDPEISQIVDTTPLFSPATPIIPAPNSQETALTPTLLATNQAIPQKSTMNSGNNTQAFNTEATATTLLAANQATPQKPTINSGNNTQAFNTEVTTTTLLATNQATPQKPTINSGINTQAFNTEVTTTTLLATNQTILNKPIPYDNLSNIGQLSFDAANSATYEKFSPFSAGTSKPILANLGESTLLPLSDSVQSPGLFNNVTSPIAQPAAIHTPHDLNLNVQVGQPKWDGEFAQKIVWMSTQQNHVAEIRLNPAHLGPVEVMLSITNDQGIQSATAQFVSSQLAVREAIDAALPKLREMMAENGIELGNVMVGADSFQQQANTEQQKHTPKQSPGSAFNSNNEPINQIETHTVSLRHNGFINTFA